MVYEFTLHYTRECFSFGGQRKKDNQMHDLIMYF